MCNPQIQIRILCQYAGLDVPRTFGTEEGCRIVWEWLNDGATDYQTVQRFKKLGRSDPTLLAGKVTEKKIRRQSN